MMRCESLVAAVCAVLLGTLCLPSRLMAPPVARWELTGAPSCLVLPCAIFRPQGGHAERQGAFSSLVLQGPGTLELPDGTTILRRGDAVLEFTGPLRLFIAADGTFTLLSAGAGFYRHPPGQPSRLRIVFPAYIAGTEGTAFRFISTPGGAFFLEVLESRVVLRPFHPSTRPLVLEPDSALFAEDRDMSVGRHKLISGQSRIEPQRKRYTADLTGSWRPRAVREQDIGCVKPLRPLTVAPALRADDELIFALVSERLARCALSENVESALEMHALFPASPLSARALYQAWLQAVVLQDGEAASRLSNLLLKGHADSPWTIQLPAAREAVFPTGAQP